VGPDLRRVIHQCVRMIYHGLTALGVAPPSSTPLTVANAYTSSYPRHTHRHSSPNIRYLLWRQTRRFGHSGSGRIIPRAGGVRDSFGLIIDSLLSGQHAYQDYGVRYGRSAGAFWVTPCSRLHTYLRKILASHWRFVLFLSSFQYFLSDCSYSYGFGQHESSEIHLLSSLPRRGVLYGTFDHHLPPLPGYSALEGEPPTERRIPPALLFISLFSPTAALILEIPPVSFPRSACAQQELRYAFNVPVTH
jgi:hypothetical protein